MGGEGGGREFGPMIRDTEKIFNWIYRLNGER